MSSILPGTLVVAGDIAGELVRFVPAGELPVPHGTMTRGWAGARPEDRYLVRVERHETILRGQPELHVLPIEKVVAVVTIRDIALVVSRTKAPEGFPEALARFVLRVSGPEMRERIAATLRVSSGCAPVQCNRLADAILALLCEGTP